MEQSVNFVDLNDDILLVLFAYFTFEERIKVERTCKRWHHILQRLWNSTKQLEVTLFYGAKGLSAPQKWRFARGNKATRTPFDILRDLKCKTLEGMVAPSIEPLSEDEELFHFNGTLSVRGNISSMGQRTCVGSSCISQAPGHDVAESVCLLHQIVPSSVPYKHEFYSYAGDLCRQLAFNVVGIEMLEPREISIVAWLASILSKVCHLERFAMTTNELSLSGMTIFFESLSRACPSVCEVSIGDTYFATARKRQLQRISDYPWKSIGQLTRITHLYLASRCGLALRLRGFQMLLDDCKMLESIHITDCDIHKNNQVSKIAWAFANHGQKVAPRKLKLTITGQLSGRTDRENQAWSLIAGTGFKKIAVYQGFAKRNPANNCILDIHFY